jgi:DNA polymerase III subunit chi
MPVIIVTESVSSNDDVPGVVLAKMSTAPAVDFYLLPSAKQTALLNFVCRLSEKALNRGANIYINCQQPALAEQLDELLYSFRPDSFLPHIRILSPPDTTTFTHTLFPVLIGGEQYQTPDNWFVINLADEYYPAASRVAEIVANEESARSQSRQKFTQYKQQGFELRTHKL